MERTTIDFGIDLGTTNSAIAVRMGIVAIGAVPLCVAAVGVIVWRRRRRL